MIIDNKVNDIKTVLCQSPQHADFTSQQQLMNQHQDATLCLAEKCTRLIHVTDNNGHVPLQNSDTNGHVSSQTCPAVIDTKGHVPLPTTEVNGHVPSQTCPPASDTSGQVPSVTTSRTVSKSRCHPLCCCEQCSQLFSPVAVNTLPDVYSSNELGFSGRYFNMTLTNNLNVST